MGKFYTFIFLLFTSIFAFSQNEANNWYFGNLAGISFNSGSAVAVTNGQLNTIEGCSSISDASGNLLFYTDGTTVWNKNHVLMTNGNGLKGNSISSQSGIIVPKPGSPTVYYIFTIDFQGGLNGAYPDGNYDGFKYSEVDMTLSAGLGAVVAARKNVNIKDSTTESLAAVKHSNGTDYWVVVHGTRDNRYYSYLITSAGVNIVPVISATGPNVFVNSINSGQGANGIIKISPDGRKIAATHYGYKDLFNVYYNRDLVISDFNNSTGIISNSITIPIQTTVKSDGPYGVEFSNCTEYLYVTEPFFDTTNATPWPLESRIWRFDMNAGSIPASQTLFQLVPAEYLGALQMAIDGKIYVSRWNRVGASPATYNFSPNGGNSLHAINNSRFLTATFTSNAINLAGRFSKLGLPPFIATYFYSTNIKVDSSSLCFGDSTSFKGITSSYDSIRWDFGDPISGINNTSTLINPKHLFSANGTYTIRFYKYLCGIKDSALKTITINLYPVVTDLIDQNICSGSITLDATSTPVTSYLWSTSATTPTITVSLAGLYKVIVNNNGCIRRDSMNLTVGGSTPISVSISPNINNICSGTNTTFIATPNVSGLSPNYQWYLNGNPVGTNSNTYSNNSLNNNDQVKVEMSSTLSCITGSPATSNTVIMTIKPNPVVSVNSPSICNGQQANLLASGATTYTWTNGLASVANPTTSTLTTTTTYTVTGTTAGCTGSAFATVTVKTNPVVSVNSPSICNGQQANLLASGATSYTWTNGLASVANPTTPTLTTTTTYTVTGTTAGCTGTAVATVTVKTNPLVSVNSPSICNGQQANLLASGATTYTWTNGLASIANPTTPTLTTTTTYTVTGTTAGCTGSAVATVTVKPNPVVSVNSPSICNGQQANLLASGATTFTWTNGLASIANPTTSTLTTTTTYTVTGTTAGCTGSAVATVTVNPNLVINVNSPSICNGQQANLLANGATSYTWTNGLASIANPTTPTLTTTTTYTVTGTTAGCTGSAVATVTVNPNLVINVNSPSICNGQQANLLASGATTYTWTNGLASISNPTTPILTTTTTYTVTGTTAGCTGTAVATVTVKTNPLVSVNSPSICNGQQANLLASGATSYTWTNGLASIANPTTSTLTTTTTYTVTGITAGCTGTTVATVTVNPNLVINVNSPSICNGQQANLLASGATTYTWTNGLASIANPTTPTLTTTTTYTVTGTTAGCTGTAVATVTVKTNPLVSVNSPSICNGQQANLLASGATTYTWTNGLASITNPTTSTLTTTTTYTVTGTTAGCTGTAVATVSVNPNLVINVNSPSICNGQQANLLASGATTYTWTNGLASVANPTTPTLTTTTTYTVTGTTAGCTGTAVATVTVNPNLVINVNSPSICNGQQANLLASGATTYTWTNGLSSVANPTTPTLTTTTTYTVTGLTAGCTGTAVATVTVKSNPLVSVNSPSICNGQQANLLASGATTYTWTNGLASVANPTTSTLTTTTTYTVTGTTAGCTGSAVATVTVKTNPVVSVNSPSICNGQQANLLASGATTYTWTNGLASVANPTTPTLTTTTTYTVTGTTAGCTGKAVATVTINSSGLVVSVNNPSTCIGQTAQLVASGATSYTWTSGLASIANPTTPTLTTTTTYTVTGTTAGCTGSAVATVTVNPNLIVSVNSPVICSGKSVNLIASGAASYTWSGGLPSISNPTTPVLTNPTTYIVTGTTGGCTGTANALVSILPSKNTIINDEICQGESVTIGTQTFSANGNYVVILQTSEGCDSTVNLSLTVNSLPEVNATSDITTAKINQQIQLNAISASTNLSYNWKPASLINNDSIKNPTAFINASTLFFVKVTDNNNCSNTDSVFISLLDQCTEENIYVPTAFTPNGDGINDCFGIMFPPKLSEFKMSIFNRWSELVFETENENECWNGYFKNEETSSDSYIYIISFKCYNGVNLSKKGMVTVLR